MAEKISKYRIDHRNYRKHSQKNLSLIERSLAENGAGRSILLDSSGESIAGSGTLQMAMKRGIPIREIHTNGEELIAVVRDWKITVIMSKSMCGRMDMKKCLIAKLRSLEKPSDRFCKSKPRNK